MAVESFELPLPFEDAIHVLNGRLTDAGFGIEFSEDFTDKTKRVKSWVASTGLTSSFLTPAIRVPAVPSLFYVRLAESTRDRCKVTIVSQGIPAVADLFVPVDLGPGRHAASRLAGSSKATSDWSAGKP
jgi:hypothetical protein